MNTAGDDNPFDQNNPFEKNPSDHENNPFENNQRRKRKGRQKIKMEKIENESNLQVTFSKRRAGLFKKASELNTFTGAENAIIVFSPGEKAHSFGHPDVETIANRFFNTNAPPGGDINPLLTARNDATMHLRNQELTNIEAQLAEERQRKRELEHQRNAGKSQNWFPPRTDELNHEQLDQLRRSIMNLKQDFDNKVKNATSLSLANSYVQGSNPGAVIGGSGTWTTPAGPTMGFPMGPNILGQGPRNYQFPFDDQYRAPPIFPNGSINPVAFGAGAGNMNVANHMNPSGSSLMHRPSFDNPFDPNIGNYGFTIQYPHMAGVPSYSNALLPPYNYGNPDNVVSYNVGTSNSNVEPDGGNMDSQVDGQNKYQGSNKHYGRGNNP